MVLGPYLQIISGLGLSVSHGVFFHEYEGGIRIGFGIGVAFSNSVKRVVVFHQLVTVLFKFPDLFLLFPDEFLLYLVLVLQAGVPAPL